LYAGWSAAPSPPEQVALVKRQLMSSKREPTDDELALFIYQCDRTGLDPFSRQIYAIYRWDKRLGDEKMGVQVSIDGLRLIADRTKPTRPGNAYWCGDGRRLARRLARRQGRGPGARRRCQRAQAHRRRARRVLRRRHVGRVRRHRRLRQATRRAVGKMPAVMLAKCAEALALRKAFPNETSGLYTAEEMDQADVQRDEPMVAEHQADLQRHRDAGSGPPRRGGQRHAGRDARAEAPGSRGSGRLSPRGHRGPHAVVTDEEATALREYLNKVGAPEPLPDDGADDAQPRWTSSSSRRRRRAR
jgi:phage recombination protein Bet